MSAAPAADGRREPLGRAVVLSLVAMALAVFVISNDISAMTVAVPDMERDLDATVGTVQWVINAYTLVFGVLIVTGGRLADIFGRRRMFFAGFGIFAVFSLLGALAQDAWMLIGARALMGVGGALIWPAVVGLIFAIVPAARAGLAGGLILGVSGVGNACGPMIGGLLTDVFDWRAILLLNLPVAAVAVLVTLRTVKPDPSGEEREKVDLLGVATLSLALVAFLVALDQATDWGWGDWRIVVLLILSVVALGAFAATQRRTGVDVLVPRSVIGNSAFRAACLATLLTSGIWFVAMLYAPQFTQKLLDFNALESGIALLPMMALFALTSFVAGPLYNKVGPRPLLIAGAALMPIGIVLLSFLDADSSYGAMVPGLAVLGVGAGFFYSTLTNAAITTLDAEQASLGGGILFMFQLVGGTIGLGLTTTVVLGVSDGAAGGAEFVDGLTAGFRVDAALGILGLIAAAMVVRRRMARSS
ncbi:MAG TPA: MFS transporter [Capillimicrobium sp.]|nr:MFS transporter [Capillimicrobium sp.]